MKVVFMTPAIAIKLKMQTVVLCPRNLNCAVDVATIASCTAAYSRLYISSGTPLPRAVGKADGDVDAASCRRQTVIKATLLLRRTAIVTRAIAQCWRKPPLRYL